MVIGFRSAVKFIKNLVIFRGVGTGIVKGHPLVVH